MATETKSSQTNTDTTTDSAASSQAPLVDGDDAGGEEPDKPKFDRTPTSTSSFGSSGRISHDSSAYYKRAIQPGVIEVEDEGEDPVPAAHLDRVFVHTSEDMHELPDRSVHLMVTSPPYNVGKEYDEDLSLDDYLGLLKRVLAETYRVLVPGGRACVNVANLGRKPYIPLHAYVIAFAAEMKFQMRGEIIWAKGAGAGTSTAWGSWRSASNPTLRDTHEYVLVFQKPPFRRPKRDGQESTIGRDDFLDATRSVWTIGTASAKNAGHPAPFPIELPRRLIQLYTYSGDVVLDPFIGTGATAIAAADGNRRWIGYEISQEYADRVVERLSEDGR
jgi:site-specific DNA-methyltransferase (adenine-specific)